jgi:hypothetical protein
MSTTLNTFIHVSIILSIVFGTLFLGCRIASHCRAKRRRNHCPPDTETHSLPVSQAIDVHPIAQSTGEQAVPTLEVDSTSDVTRTQQEGAFAPYAKPTSEDVRPAAVVVGERRALERHAHYDTSSPSSTSQLLPPAPSLDVPATSRTR